ncbi:MAG: hypothetical protein IPK08_07990 [Bacteroidetes bacterium]|nr:hypothetical protein [Bacteroidota bacterium]
MLKKDIDQIKDPEKLDTTQRKVTYEPVLTAPDGNVKTEIRMLYSWEEKG